MCSFHARGSEKVGDIEARIVDVNADGAAIRWFVDPQTGHILKETYRTLGPSGPVQGETDMDDWKPMAGMTFPLVRHNKQNGQDSSTAEYTAMNSIPRSIRSYSKSLRKKLQLSPDVSPGKQKCAGNVKSFASNVTKLANHLMLYTLPILRRSNPARDSRPVPNKVSVAGSGAAEYPMYSCGVPPQLWVPAIGV